jgi:hypothetical protein
LLYKVWTKDGHEELVRGAVFGELDVRALRSSMVAAGDDFYVGNRPANIPYSIVAPSILFDELEVKRANLNKEKLPDYPAPAVKEKVRRSRCGRGCCRRCVFRLAHAIEREQHQEG